MEIATCTRTDWLVSEAARARGVAWSGMQPSTTLLHSAQDLAHLARARAKARHDRAKSPIGRCQDGIIRTQLIARTIHATCEAARNALSRGGEPDLATLDQTLTTLVSQCRDLTVQARHANRTWSKAS